MHDDDEEDYYLIHEMGAVFLPIDTINSIRKLLGKNIIESN